MSFLSIRNIKKSYGNNPIIKGIDIEVEKGDFLVLVGPSGCGKSTLLNMIAGLTDITSGEIVLDGKVINDTIPSKRNIAMVFQSYALYPNMTVAKNLSFSLEMHKVPKEEIKRLVTEVAETLQITNLLKRKPAALSGGQRQRVAMGRALVRDPQVFLFDEPLSNLDAKLRVDMRSEIRQLHQRLKTTIVYVTHDQVEAMTLSSKIAVMKDGYLHQLGSAEEIYKHPNNVFVAQFMGSPSMNILKGNNDFIDGMLSFSIAKEDDDSIHPAYSTISLEPIKQTISKDYQVNNILLGIRPEDVILSTSDSYGSIKAIIKVVENAGADSFVTLSVFGQKIIARMPGAFKGKQDEVIYITFDANSVSLFDIKTEENILLNNP